VSSAQYLYRRASGVYFVRFCVPAALKGAVGRGEVHRTTGCRDLRLAKIVAAQMAIHWHRSLEQLVRMDIKKIVVGSVDLLGEGTITLETAAAAVGTSPTRLLQELEVHNAPLMVEARDWSGWLLSDIYDLEHEQDEHGLRGVVIDPVTLDKVGERRSLTQAMAVRFIEEVRPIVTDGVAAAVCQFLLWPSQRRAFVVDLPGRSLSLNDLHVNRRDVERVRATLASQLTTIQIAQASPAPAPNAMQISSIAEPKHADLRLSALMVDFIARHKEQWRPNTLHTNQDRCMAAVELLDDPRLGDIDRPGMLAYTDMLKKLPNDRHKVRARFQLPNANFRDLIALADEHSLPRLTPAALEKMINGIAELFSWAHRQRFIKENPATGLGAEVFASTGTKKSRASDERDPFSADDLSTIFGAVWFQTGTGTRTKNGGFYQYRPHYYWLPLLGLFVGGRLNELSQLYLADIRVSEAGTHYFDFNLDSVDKVDVDDDDESEGKGKGKGGVAPSKPDKNLKNTYSARKIPIHPKLVELGIIKYVEALKLAGHNRLFPELKHDLIKGYGKAAGRWFNERYLGNKLGIERNGRKTFHSLRHNYATALGSGDVPTAIKSQLLGHSRGSSMVEKRYDKGASVEGLVEHLGTLRYDLPQIATFDCEAGIEAIKDAIDLKARH